MQHRMAVGAHWDQVSFRIQTIVLFNLRQRHQMMNVDKAPTDIAIALRHIEAEHLALTAMIAQPGEPGDRVHND